jgi:hypothetical protein
MHDASDLEFPDWSGMKEHPVRMTFSEAVAWNEDMLKMFPPRPRTSEQRCDVEFKLWRCVLDTHERIPRACVGQN